MIPVWAVPLQAAPIALLATAVVARSLATADYNPVPKTELLRPTIVVAARHFRRPVGRMRLFRPISESSGYVWDLARCVGRPRLRHPG
jgi:hypothetical protein